MNSSHCIYHFAYDIEFCYIAFVRFNLTLDWYNFWTLVCHFDCLGGVNEVETVGGGCGGAFPTWQSFQLRIFWKSDIFHV